MKALRITEDIIPISEFKSHAAEWLKRVAGRDQPLVITQNGKPAGVLLSPAVCDQLAERALFVAAVQDGLADAKAGRMTEHAIVAAEMKQRYGRPSAR